MGVCLLADKKLRMLIDYSEALTRNMHLFCIKHHVLESTSWGR